MLDDPAALVGALERLLRAGAWNIGIGIGAVETPLPDQARAGRGPAYLARARGRDRREVEPVARAGRGRRGLRQ